VRQAKEKERYSPEEQFLRPLPPEPGVSKRQKIESCPRSIVDKIKEQKKKEADRAKLLEIQLKKHETEMKSIKKALEDALINESKAKVRNEQLETKVKDLSVVGSKRPRDASSNSSCLDGVVESLTKVVKKIEVVTAAQLEDAFSEIKQVKAKESLLQKQLSELKVENAVLGGDQRVEARTVQVMMANQEREDNLRRQQQEREDRCQEREDRMRQDDRKDFLETIRMGFQALHKSS